jgi:hypothetical protein
MPISANLKETPIRSVPEKCRNAQQSRSATEYHGTYSAFSFMATTVRYAVVVGAGPVGCLAALALAKRGWRVDLFEGRPGSAADSITPYFDFLTLYFFFFFQIYVFPRPKPPHSSVPSTSPFLIAG